ncbi:TIGR02266 family protein [Myxococcus sp. K38C18041901]|uniref:TIGR02266 family protein n=1 Tax=Myxococcus guangdongensis TaxID=2906760 RepID=UPI0020A75E07|nr:TIGR02266 family protein [Myxococcus guangdongensis]MCP3058511.1 TIGR02266 family protein [Myxococcus guangdongensis]
MTPGPENKRQHPRIPAVLKVEYADGRQARDVTENLSHSGLFVQTDQAFTLGEDVRLALSFPGLLDPVEVTGIVAWMRPAGVDQPGGVGVRVERAEDRRRLGDILSAAGPNSHAPHAEHEGYRVLIVEDNPHIIEMYSYVLKKLASGELHGKVPLEVHFAPDGHHALGMLREGRFSLVMTDLYMPVMDGFALVERIREDEVLKGIPVIAISAGGKEAQDRALQLGVDIYLRKPVKFVEVLETVKQLLRIR